MNVTGFRTEQNWEKCWYWEGVKYLEGYQRGRATAWHVMRPRRYLPGTMMLSRQI